jgi:hypothetical protein
MDYGHAKLPARSALSFLFRHPWLLTGRGGLRCAGPPGPLLQRRQYSYLARTGGGTPPESGTEGYPHISASQFYSGWDEDMQPL